LCGTTATVVGRSERQYPNPSFETDPDAYAVKAAWEREGDQGGTPRWVKGGDGPCETGMQAFRAPPLPCVARAVGPFRRERL
jgi:hypothetical protein